MSQTKNQTFKLLFDENSNIATLSMNSQEKINKINENFIEDFEQAVSWAIIQKNLQGIIITSLRKEFCVGADLNVLSGRNKINNLIKSIERLNATLRILEKCKHPTVAAINGSAIGGGYEIALACNRRIFVKSKQAYIALPEIKFGLIPGAGGTQRLPRLIGIQSSLELILQKEFISPDKALALGLVDLLVNDNNDLIYEATKWIQRNKSPKQPWDRPQSKIPGPQVDSEDARNIFIITCAMLEKKATAFLAPKLALCSIQEGLRLKFEQALKIEERYFYQAANSNQAKAMLRTFWHHKNTAAKLKDLPKIKDSQINKVGIIGAGMMGSDLAFICAKQGLTVVLNDKNKLALEKAQANYNKQIPEDIISNIQTTTKSNLLQNCDLIIEAVFENIQVKHQVIQEIEPLLSANAIWASNSSALPIDNQASVSINRANFIGMHFFSPATKMILVEIIVGTNTSDDTLAKSLAFVKQIGKLPIVVNDGFGFYTTRLFLAYILEGIQLVSEGHNPVLIEWAAKKAGMVVPPLQVADEVSLDLVSHFINENQKHINKNYPAIFELINTITSKYYRLGKKTGKGFYDYGAKRKIWPGLESIVKQTPNETGVDFIQNRLMLAQCAEVGRVIDDKILRNYRDAELGAIFGVGFAPHTGGPLSYMDHQGLENTVNNLINLERIFGERYKPAKVLIEKHENGTSFFQ